MKKYRSYATRVFILLLARFLFLGCIPLSDDGDPQELVFGVVASSDPDAQLNRMNKVVAYLSEELNMPLKYVKGTDYAAVIEAMKTEKVDIASTGSFSYLIASAKARAEPLVATRYRNGGMNNYGSIIFTRAESNIQSMDDVKARSGELSIAFSDPASTSGYLYPMSYLRSIGLEPGEKFKERLFAGGHTAGIFSALAGKVDLACTTSSSLEKLARAGRIEPNSYRVLWRSDEIPPSPVYVRAELPESIKQNIREAYVNMDEKALEVMEYVRGMYNKDLVYVPVTDSLYTDMRSLVNKELENIAQTP